MKKITKDFIEIAYAALQKAYWMESDGCKDNESENAKKVGDALQKVGDLTREPLSD